MLFALDKKASYEEGFLVEKGEDDWGGHYDHAIPPYKADDNEGWGLRVPSMMLNPYTKKATGVKT